MLKCKYFVIEELVSKNTYNYYTNTLKYSKDFCWKFFDKLFVSDLDTIREEWEKYLINLYGRAKAEARVPLTINNWKWGGALTQCGLRTNRDPLVSSKSTPYCSGHVLAKAVDLHTKYPSDTKYLWDMIANLIKTGKLKYFRRLETKTVTVKQNYVHTDGFQTVDGSLEVFIP